jgi:hypothetical protein
MARHPVICAVIGAVEMGGAATFGTIVNGAGVAGAIVAGVTVISGAGLGLLYSLMCSQGR